MSAMVWLLEGLKLLGQLAGAAFIGWIGVRWALARYKSEKTWERQLAAYTDVLGAFTDMQRVLAEWEHLEINDRQLSDEEANKLINEFDLAQRSVAQASGLASLLLPAEITKMLQKLPHELRQASRNAATYYDSLDTRWDIIEQAKTKIVEIAKKDLGLG